MRNDIPDERSAAIYARVSSGAQSGPDKYSEQTQVEECLKWASKQNPPLVVDPELIIVEPPHSGEDLEERIGLMRLIDLAERGAYHHLICLQVKRLTRGGASHMGMIMYRLERADVKVHFLMNDMGDSPFAGMVYSFEADHGKLENKERVEAMLRARKARARRQYVGGSRAPYGYMYDVKDFDPQAGRLRKRHLLHDPVTAPIVEMIFNMLAYKGYSLRQLCRYLNGNNPDGRKYPTPAQHNGRAKAGENWSPGSLRQLIYEPKYWGVFAAFRTVSIKRGPRDRNKNGERFKSKVQRKEVDPANQIYPDEGVVIGAAIVSKETARLAHANTTDGKIRRNRLESDNAKGMLLAGGGVLVCAYCLHTMTLHKEHVRKDGTILWSYRCNTRQSTSREACPRGPTISATPLDNAVWQRVLYLLDHMNYFMELAEFGSEHEKGAANPTTWLSTIEGRLNSVQRRIDNLMRQMEVTSDPDEEADMRSRHHELSEERRGLRSELDKARAIQEEAQARRAALLSIADSADEIRQTALREPDFQRFLLRKILGVRVVVWKKEDRTPRVQLLIRVSAAAARHLQSNGVQWTLDNEMHGVVHDDTLPSNPEMEYYATVDEFDPDSSKPTALFRPQPTASESTTRNSVTNENVTKTSKATKVAGDAAKI